MNKKRERRHLHTSSESSLDRFDKFTRKRIIHRWNDEYISNKKIEEKRKLMEKLERHKRHKHRKKHKHHEHNHEHEKDSDDSNYDKYEKLKKKKYKEDLKFEEDKADKLTEKSKSKSKSKKSEKIVEKFKSKSKSKSKSKTPSKEIKIDSDEEETISAGEFEKK